MQSRFAVTTAGPKGCKLRRFISIAKECSTAPPFPLTVDTLYYVGGAMRAAGYRSTDKYLIEAGQVIRLLNKGLH